MNELVPPGGRPLLIVDDDPTFARVLGRAMTSRGFEVITADNADDARALTRRHQPRYCVLDLKLGDENGLRLIPELQSLVPHIRVLLGQGVERNDLTGYAWLKVAAEVIFPGYQKIVKSLEGAMTPEQRKQADAGAARKIDLYGLAATNMSCGTHASRGGHIVDEILCTPRIEGQQLLLRRCAEEPAR